MGENSEIVLANKPGEKQRGWLPRKLEEIATSRTKKGEEKRLLSENEKAKERMSDISWRLRKLLDSSDFREKETPNEFSSDPSRVMAHVYIPNFQGQDYSIRTTRNKQTEQVYMIEVYTSPSNKEDYSSGVNDGYFRIYFHKDVSTPKKGERERLIWGNTSIHGDTHLGIETSSVIDELQVDDLATRIHLRSVDFGGWPSINLTLLTSPKDKEGNFLGPIGKINEINIHGIARAKHPVGGHISDSDFETIQIGEDFDGYSKPFIFDRGGANFEMKKVKDSETKKEVLAFRFSGIRKRFSGDRDQPIVVGPEQQVLAVPIDLINGNRVIDLFEKAVDSTIAACAVKPQLEATNY